MKSFVYCSFMGLDARGGLYDPLNTITMFPEVYKYYQEYFNNKAYTEPGFTKIITTLTNIF